MSNKKHTAVEWIEAYLKTYTSFNLHKIIEKAKEIEKEQIIHTWNTRAKIDGIITFTDNRTAEQYYKETYETGN